MALIRFAGDDILGSIQLGLGIRLAIRRELECAHIPYEIRTGEDPG